MELLEGDDLQYELARVGAMPWTRAVTIARQVVAGLAAAHRCGVVHRDVKPSNILLVSDDTEDAIKVIDFGIARAAEGPGAARLTAAHRAIGTPQYLAPEVAQGEVADERSDQYDVGIVLYEMLTGTVPYRGVRPNEILSKHVRARIPSVREMVGDVPREVDQIVRRCMAKDPAERFGSMGELLMALAAVSGGTAVAPMPVALVERTQVSPPPWPMESLPTTAVEVLASGDYDLVEAEEEPRTAVMIKKTAPGERIRQEFVDAPPAWPPRKHTGPSRTGATVAVDAVPLEAARPWWKTATFGLAATLVVGLTAIGGTVALLSDDEPAPTVADAADDSEATHPLLTTVAAIEVPAVRTASSDPASDADDEDEGDDDDDPDGDDEQEASSPMVPATPEPATLAPPPPPPPPPGATATVGPYAENNASGAKRRRGRST